MLKLLRLNEKLSSKSFKILLIIIFGFGLLFRLFNLKNNPVAISHDELDYVLNGKMIALTGSDLTQTWQPTSLTPIETETLTSELFPVLQAIVFKFLPLNLFNARLASLLFSSLTVFMLGLLVEKITKNKQLALTTSLVFALNPWSVLFAHTAYEAPNTLFFYITGIYLLVSLGQEKKLSKAILLSIFSFLTLAIGFYSYHGYKLIFPLLVGIPFVWQWLNADKKTKVKLTKPYLVFSALMLLLVAKFMFSMTGYGDRQAELIFLNQDLLAKLVNSTRQLGFVSPITSIFLNKYTILLREIGIRYLAVFNPTNLFVTGGDATVLFSLFQTGYLYFIESVLIFIGGWFLYKKHQQAFYLFITLLLIAPLPAALHQGTSTALRAGLIFPILAIFIAAGWYQLLISKGVINFVLKVIAIGCLVINLSYFIYVFNNNYPVYSADNYFFNERLLSQYLSLIKNNNQEVIVLTKNPYPAFRAYLFYQDQLKPALVGKLVPEFQKGVTADYKLENILWTDDCEELKKVNTNYLIVEESLITECEITSGNWYQQIHQQTQSLPQFIASPIDSRGYYVLFNNDLCEHEDLAGYVYNNSQSSFEIEKLRKEEFCSDWVIKDSNLNNKLWESEEMK